MAVDFAILEKNFALFATGPANLLAKLLCRCVWVDEIQGKPFSLQGNDKFQLVFIVLFTFNLLRKVDRLTT